MFRRNFFEEIFQRNLSKKSLKEISQRNLSTNYLLKESLKGISQKNLSMEAFLIIIITLYRHSSYNAVLLYYGIPSNAVFSKPKTVLKFYLARFIQNFFFKNLKKKCFWSNFFFSILYSTI